MAERNPQQELLVYSDKLVDHLESALVRARRINELALVTARPLVTEELTEARHMIRRVNEDLSHASDAAEIVKYVIDRTEEKNKTRE